MSKLVIVIDDSLTVRKVLEISLRRDGYETISYSDGFEALQAVTKGQLSRIPDLVILDIDLPKLDGYDLIRHLKAKPQWSKTVFVILSRRDSILDHLKARLAGAANYLTEPFTIQKIMDEVEAHLGPSPASREGKRDSAALQQGASRVLAEALEEADNGGM